MTPQTVSPAVEVRRLRGQLAAAVADLEQTRANRDLLRALLATPDPLTDPDFWRSLFADGHRAELEAKWSAGYLAAVAEMKQVQHDLVAALRAAAPPAARWHVCCVPCRRTGHRAGCRGCQDRNRATFAAPIAGDYQGGPVEWDAKGGAAA
jgi:hypothetical protein